MPKLGTVTELPLIDRTGGGRKPDAIRTFIIKNRLQYYLLTGTLEKKFELFGIKGFYLDGSARELLSLTERGHINMQQTDPFKGLDELLTAKLKEFGGKKVKIVKHVRPGAGRHGSDEFNVIILANPENIAELNALLAKRTK